MGGINRRLFDQGLQQIYGLGNGVAAVASWLAYDGSSDGSPVVLGTVAQTSPIDRGIDACILSSTRAIIAMPDSANSQFGTAVLIDISGTSPTVLDTFVFQSTAMLEVKVVTVDSRFAVVYYLDSGGTERGRVIDTNSDTLANVGSEQDLSGTINIGTSSGGRWDFDLIDTAEHVGIFRNESVSSNLFGLVIGINTGTGTLTLNTATQLSTSNLSDSFRTGVKATSTTTFVMNGAFDTNIVRGVSGSKSGTSISSGSDIQLASNAVGRILNNPSINNDLSNVYVPMINISASVASLVAVVPISGSTLSQETLRGTNINTVASKSVSGAYILYMESIGDLDYFVGISYDGSVDDFAFSGFEYDNITEQLRSSGAAFKFAAIRGDAIDQTAIERISTDKVILAGRDSNNSSRITMFVANK